MSGARAARFRTGETVYVRDLAKPGHVRIPHYVREKTGRVEQYCGIYLNPEDLAVGNTGGPAIHLYRVSFDQNTLWPEDGHRTGDRLVIEIYEHWLAPADGQKTDRANGPSNEQESLHDGAA